VTRRGSDLGQGNPPAAHLLMISTALCQTKGFGSSFHFAVQASIASMRTGTDENTRRCRRLVVSSEN
jgi:hypothetical protein